MKIPYQIIHPRTKGRMANRRKRGTLSSFLARAVFATSIIIAILLGLALIGFMLKETL